MKASSDFYPDRLWLIGDTWAKRRTSEKEPGSVEYVRADIFDELAAWAGKVDAVKEALVEFSAQHRCGCGHPRCNSCDRDRMAREALSGLGRGIE